MTARRTTPDQIVAHVDLLRAIDRLLEQAQAVREKRQRLTRLFPEKVERAAGGKKGEHK